MRISEVNNVATFDKVIYNKKSKDDYKRTSTAFFKLKEYFKKSKSPVYNPIIFEKPLNPTCANKHQNEQACVKAGRVLSLFTILPALLNQFIFNSIH